MENENNFDELIETFNENTEKYMLFIQNISNFENIN